MTWILSLVTGAGVLLLYLAAERVLPRALTFGDSFLLGFIALMFGLLMLTGVLFGAALSYWLVFLSLSVGRRRERKRNAAERPDLYPIIKSRIFVFVSLFLNGLFLLFVYLAEPSQEIILTVLYFVVVGLFLLAVFGVLRPGCMSFLEKASLLALVVFGAMVSMKPMLLDFTMTAVGVRGGAGQLVSMGYADKAKVEAVAQMHDLSVRFCEMAGTGLQGSTDVQVVWHRVGDVSYVRIGEAPIRSRKSLLIPLGKDVETYPATKAKAACDDEESA